MKVIIVNDYEELSVEAYKIVKGVMLNNDKTKIGFATGGTPVGLYKKLIKGYRKGDISFKNVTTFNLDEYVGLDKEDKQSYYHFMKYNLFDYIDINFDNVNFLNGVNKDINAECERYNNLLNESEIDIQILGVGSNGHIAFNEPGTSFESETHIVNLSDSTIEDNSRFFESVNEVPRKALTMGINNIMKAKRLLILVNGMSKKDAVFSLFNEKISTELPISIIKKHKDATLICDKLSFSKLIRYFEE